MERALRLIQHNPNYKPYELPNIDKLVREYSLELASSNKYTNEYLAELTWKKKEELETFQATFLTALMNYCIQFQESKRVFKATCENLDNKGKAKLKALEVFIEELRIKRYPVTIKEERTGKRRVIRTDLGVRHRADLEKYVIVE